MNTTAFIFPGQGAQYVGMGKELCAQSAAAKKVYDLSAAALGFDIGEVSFQGPLDALTRSSICQPAIVTFSWALMESWRGEAGGGSLMPAVCAGLSLGEYTALVACGSLEFSDAVRLVHKRGLYMDEASREHPGGMSCILGLAGEKAAEVCAKSGAEIANLNCPGQVVISGTFAAIEKAAVLAQEAGARRIIPLEVSGPFHCSLMKSAAKKLALELEHVVIRQPQAVFIPNVTAEPVSDPHIIKELLIRQVAQTTYWEKSVARMQGMGISRYYEIGPGKVLRGLLQRIERGLSVISIEAREDTAQLPQASGGKS
ncbi:MAG: ACP S-malonyltransferase [Candidatus Omnitrophica bacterium]|nr:ACP S-malonyltransferase [Candidatus Omnitrophota bacterium]